MTRAEFLQGMGATALTALSASTTVSNADGSLDFDDFRRSRPSLDIVAAMAAALEMLGHAGGGMLQLGPGIHDLPSVALGRNGVTLPAGTTLRGAGRDATRLRVVGASPCNVLRIVNASNVAVRDLGIEGNSRSLGEASGAAITAFLLPGATSDMENIAIENVALSNFAAPYWIQVENDHGGAAYENLKAGLNDGTRTMRDIRLHGIDAHSRPGNSLAPALVTVHAHAVRVSGFSGYVEDVAIDDLRVEATYIKGGLSIGHRVRRVIVREPVVVNAGQAGARNDAAAYAIELYDTFGNCRDVTIDRPRLENPRSCGLYIAGGIDVSINQPVVFGQTDPLYTTLPKGAVVLNGTVRARINGGTLTGNYIDISVCGPIEERRMAHVIQGVRTAGSAFRSLYISYSPAQAITSGIAVSDCDFLSNGCAVVVQCSARYRIDDVVLDRCAIATTRGGNALAVDWYVDSGSASEDCGMRACTIKGPIRVREITGRFFAENIQAFCSAPGGIAFQFYACARLALKDCTGHDGGRQGAAFDLRLSSGTVERCRSVDCERASLGDLGSRAPTRQGIAGEFVQNLAPAGPDATSGIIEGWRNAGGTHWVEQRRRP